MQAKTVLTRVKGMGFRWSVNPYRGCAHGCHYCFARATHWYLDLSPSGDFSSLIFAKVNASAVLRQELARHSWKHELVVVGTATDPYQPVEGRYRITRGLLEAFRDHRTPASIVTKGTMVVRDLDLLADLARRAGVTVNFSITTLDRELSRQLEPGTPPATQRLRALEQVVAAGVPAGVMLAPLVPGITTLTGNLEAVVKAAAAYGAQFIGANVLYLKPGVKEHFLDFLASIYPHLTRGYERLYRGAHAPIDYKTALLGMVRALQERHLVPPDTVAHAPMAPHQLAMTL